jgi:hypothetical protein
MDVASVILTLQCRNDGNDEIIHSKILILKATDEGMNVEYLSRTTAVKSDELLRKWFFLLTETECINHIILTVSDSSGEILYTTSHSLEHITKLRKQDENNIITVSLAATEEDDDGWDYSPPMVYCWYYGTCIVPFVKEVGTTHKLMKMMKEIVGLECPVLTTPLTRENARQFDKCKHWISEEALTGITRQENTSVLKCPLCRAEHSQYMISRI